MIAFEVKVTSVNTEKNWKNGEVPNLHLKYEDKKQKRNASIINWFTLKIVIIIVKWRKFKCAYEKKFRRMI